MNKTIKKFIPQAVAACTLAAAASSQAFLNDLDGGSFYVVPSAGFHMTQKMHHYKHLEKEYKKEDLKVDFDNAADYGISLGYQIDGFMAIEIADNYTKFDIKASHLEAGKKVSDKKSTNYNYLHVDALYYFNDIYENAFSFYIPVGLGWIVNDPKNAKKGDGFKKLQDTGVNFGVGAQYMFNDMIGVRGDVRGIYGFSQENLDAIAQVGLMIRFGKPVNVGDSKEQVKSVDVLFKLNSTDIVNLDAPSVQAAAKVLRNHPDAKIKIFAYSDSSGTNAYNMKLSQRRAAALKSIMVNDFGIEPERIYTKAFGDENHRSKSRHAIALIEY